VVVVVGGGEHPWPPLHILVGGLGVVDYYHHHHHHHHYYYYYYYYCSL